jgi:hypothetical protein
MFVIFHSPRSNDLPGFNEKPIPQAQRIGIGESNYPIAFDYWELFITPGVKGQITEQ